MLPKTSMSIMFCVDEAGKLITFYVIYQSTEMWTTWTEDGSIYIPSGELCAVDDEKITVELTSSGIITEEIPDEVDFAETRVSVERELLCTRLLN